MSTHIELGLPREMRGGLWKKQDPFFSSLVVFSLMLHAGAVYALRGVAPPPEMSVEDIPAPILHWMPRTPLLKQQPRPKEPRKMAAPSSNGTTIEQKKGALNTVQLRLLHAMGPGTSIGDVFSSEGPTTQLARQLEDAVGVDLDHRDVGNGPRGSRDSRGPVGITALGLKPSSGVKDGTVTTRHSVEVVAQVEAEELPDLDGDLDPKVVARIIRSRIAGFRNCYENALKRSPKLGGKVTVEFTIAEDGRVSDANTDVDTVQDAEMAHCLTGQMKRIHFPSPRNGSVHASFPFVFVRVD